MATKAGQTWQTATIDIDRDSEFSGDDVDQFSGVVDLQEYFDGVALKLPALTNSAITLYNADNATVSTVPLVLHVMKADLSATAAWTVSAGTGSIQVIARGLGAVRFLRVRCTKIGRAHV